MSKGEIILCGLVAVILGILIYTGKVHETTAVGMFSAIIGYVGKGTVAGLQEKNGVK